jgi:hypothetical protein
MEDSKKETATKDNTNLQGEDMIDLPMTAEKAGNTVGGRHVRVFDGRTGTFIH